jgi:aromatic-L-amino-acid decarboxylase
VLSVGNQIYSNFFRQVLSSVEPGYLQCLLPAEAPSIGEPWQSILQDLDKIIIPGLTHWHSPNFHAYYPTANSFPGIVGELLLSGLGVISTDWVNHHHPL